MTILVILLLLALVFGVGAVLEGLAWLLLLSLAFVVAAVVAVVAWFRGGGGGRRVAGPGPGR